ncbi:MULTISPECIES: Fe-S cluster assembly protein SufD [Crocosphaera]|uniref:Iron-sulfur cluster assembly protein SufD n=2 Tax=Crocosphaera watsonii TaxID=263511 RepID=T2JRS8_CROWT|nr:MULTISPECIES: Fe-S cluster assembly protein SufD [Crocosphaera]EHJ15056.1 Iron-sulfur cluster assembly protein SufD [Crocosphaera watsonii WH 0003]MCH2245439.1 Fe-S cluster assembly protein SufD [Crocosphaera sp.]NQZ63962.1 Fe-S cluster assembly protein SufD [Crocosphaera sp.]CCQ67744.1 Iron-sulfur cluster assembly protein SufD [Crocosphaera watsonii WH 0402]
MNTPTVQTNRLENYLNHLLEQCQANSPLIDADYLHTLRKNAVSQVQELTLPKKKDEEWRFTDLSKLYELDLTIGKTEAVSKNIVDQFILPEAKQSYLVFVNGEYASELSNVSALSEGVSVGNLSHLSDAQTEKIVNYLGKSEGEKDTFSALNTAGLSDAAVIWINKNVVLETPIMVLFLAVSSETASLIQPRTLVIAETGSSATLVEYYGTITEQSLDVKQNEPYFTNSVTEICLDGNAHINHNRIQRELGNSFHIGRSIITQNQDSHYTCNEINLGAKVSRHTLQIIQNGTQTESNLNGLTMIGNEQVADTHTAVCLNHPHGVTHQLHKCIMDGNSRGVFNGKIFVPKPAQLTSATQLNRNLLLSPKARINTKPELQITADNVKCSHGATISQLEADELFYLQSRGLNESDARHLLIDAFAAEILERIPLDSLQQSLTKCVVAQTTEV